MNDIKLIYTDGEEKILPYKDYGKNIEKIAEKLKSKKSLTYYKFLEGKLLKAYIGNKLVIDREKLLEVAE